jgi:hypothetical protein
MIKLKISIIDQQLHKLILRIPACKPHLKVSLPEDGRFEISNPCLDHALCMLKEVMFKNLNPLVRDVRRDRVGEHGGKENSQRDVGKSPGGSRTKKIKNKNFSKED